MKRFSLLVVFLLFVLANAKAQETYVLVHGAWGGAWQWKKIDSLLTAGSHTVYRPTLTGLGERVHLATKEINLEVHIQDVANTILFENLHDIILIGHSYGGMVITGVADKLPERIKKIVYMDAFLPEDGESVVNLNSSKTKSSLPTTIKDGFIIPNWVKPDKPYPFDVPHPLATLTQKISLKNPDRLKIKGAYILTVDEGKDVQDDTFYDSYLRAKKLGYDTSIMSADHNPQWFKPKELLPFLTK